MVKECKLKDYYLIGGCENCSMNDKEKGECKAYGQDRVQAESVSRMHKKKKM